MSDIEMDQRDNRRRKVRKLYLCTSRPPWPESSVSFVFTASRMGWPVAFLTRCSKPASW